MQTFWFDDSTFKFLVSTSSSIKQLIHSCRFFLNHNQLSEHSVLGHDITRVLAHIFKRRQVASIPRSVSRSVGRSVGLSVGLSVGRSVCLSVLNEFHESVILLLVYKCCYCYCSLQYQSILQSYFAFLAAIEALQVIMSVLNNLDTCYNVVLWVS